MHTNLRRTLTACHDDGAKKECVRFCALWLQLRRLEEAQQNELNKSTSLTRSFTYQTRGLVPPYMHILTFWTFRAVDLLYVCCIVSVWLSFTYLSVLFMCLYAFVHTSCAGWPSYSYIYYESLPLTTYYMSSLHINYAILDFVKHSAPMMPSSNFKGGYGP